MRPIQGAVPNVDPLQTMPAPTPRQSRNGFSLVEMLVVVFVIGLLASVAVLSFPGDGASLRQAAERFAARTLAARDQAISGGRPIAVVLGPAGYYFEQRAGSGWQPAERQGSATLAWGDGVLATPAGGGSPGSERLRVVFDPIGLASEDAAVRLVRGGHVMTVRIARDGSVRVDGA